MNPQKMKQGTWVERDLITSEAFTALSGSAKQVLLIFYLKRQMSKKYEVKNKSNITLTYKELENLYGSDIFGNPQGLARSTITRAIDNLMTNGFIELIHQGGAFQKDKNVYGLTEDWRYWRKGTPPVRKRPPGRSYGNHALKNNRTTMNGPIDTAINGT